MTKYSPAGFLPRLLANLNETNFHFLLFALLLLILSRQNTLEKLYQGFVVYLLIIVLYCIIRMVYEVLFTHYYGGNLGKIVTGLQIRDNSGSRLSLNKIFFRQLISYRFSGLIFGLGYLAILKDPNKQAWHDKTVDSNVFKVRPLLPLSIISLLLLVGINGYLLLNIVNNFENNPVREEITKLISESQPAPQNSELNQSQFSGEFGKDYFQQDIDDWKMQLDYIDTDLQAIQIAIGDSSLDQTKIQDLNQILVEMQTIADRIYTKMSQKQTLTNEDVRDLELYDQYLNQRQELLNDLNPQ